MSSWRRAPRALGARDHSLRLPLALLKYTAELYTVVTFLSAWPCFNVHDMYVQCVSRYLPSV